MEEHSKAPWFRARALESVELALRAEDARMQTAARGGAVRRLRLALLKKRTDGLDDAFSGA